MYCDCEYVMLRFLQYHYACDNCTCSSTSTPRCHHPVSNGWVSLLSSLLKIKVNQVTFVYVGLYDMEQCFLYFIVMDVSVTKSQI